MADGIILPYLDIPFQHAHPAVLKRMARPAASVSTLEEIKNGVRSVQKLRLDQHL